jgi:small subunit ribosomal protein S12
MLTFKQLFKKSRVKKTSVLKAPFLQKNPQKKAVCLRIFVRTPKKPNSALRKLARIKISGDNSSTAYIPGEGHNLMKFSVVLVRGGRVKDLPGVKYKLIRGKFDLEPLKLRKQGRSKYGVKRWKN